MANTSNGKMAGKKSFVCIMNTKDDMQQIPAICNGNSICVSYNDIKPIQAIAEKFMAGFGDVVPQRLPDIAQQYIQAQAVAEQ